MFKIIFSILLYSSLSVAEWTYGLDTLLSVRGAKIADTAINPNNQILNFPSKETYLDLRPDLKWQNEIHKIIIRPQWLGYHTKAKNEFTNETTVRSKGELNLFDFFVETNWQSIFTSTVGLQVYQWGPAELLSPSNPLYHFNSQQRGLYYKEKGQVLLRGNFLISKESSLILIVQPISNNEPEWKEGDGQFHEKGLIKYERSWSDNSYFGLVGGIEDNQNPFIGEYLNYVPAEGYSLYFDLKHSKKPKYFEPEFDGFGFNLTEKSSQADWPLLGTVGLRYESRIDYRLEYIYNQIGYDKTTLENAIQSIVPFQSLAYPQNLRRFFRPGLELLGRHYIYTSVRIAEPLDFKELNVYGRGFYSLQDSSLQFQTEADYSVADSWTSFGGLSYSMGRKDTELRFINDWSAFLGLKFSL